MIEINTYLDGEENENIPYQEFSGQLCNDRDGTLEVIINGSTLFREEQEFIDIGWSGITYRLLEYLSKEGQPIDDTPLAENVPSSIHFESVGQIMLKITHPYYETEVLFDKRNLPYHQITEEGEKVTIVDKDEFLRVLVTEGWQFFHKIAELLPNDRKPEEINWLEKIMDSLGIEKPSIPVNY